MDVLDLLRLLARRFYRWPLVTGLVVGLLTGWGIARPGCSFKHRGGGCAWALPGENLLIGPILWGAAAGIAVAVVLLITQRLKPGDG